MMSGNQLSIQRAHYSFTGLARLYYTIRYPARLTVIQRVVTEADVRQRTVATKIETAINKLCNLLTANIEIPATAELVLDVDEGSNACGYYFVDHNSKSLFWVESHKQLLPEIFGTVPATSKSHISASSALLC